MFRISRANLATFHCGRRGREGGGRNGESGRGREEVEEIGVGEDRERKGGRGGGRRGRRKERGWEEGREAESDIHDIVGSREWRKREI